MCVYFDVCSGMKLLKMTRSFLNASTLLIAERGAWGVSPPVGYKVSSVTATGCTFRDYRPFITGFLDTETEQSWGRPVDVQMLGADILVSDDKSNAIYRFRM